MDVQEEKISQSEKKDFSASRREDSVRVLSIFLIIYFIPEAILMFIGGDPQPAAVSIVFAVMYSLTLFLSQSGRGVAAHHLSIGLLMLWCILSPLLLGWDFGGHNFLFIVLIFIFVSTYLRIRIKIFIGIWLCATRIILYFITRVYPPVFPLKGNPVYVAATINTVAMYICAMVLVIFASSYTLEMEKKLVASNDEIRKLADLDQLTGLPNRRALYEMISTDLRDSSISSLSIAIGDIDFFKNVNDTYGHDAGDVVLKELAGLFSSYMSSHGYVARWGGEEFIFVFRNSNGDDAHYLLEGLRVKVSSMVIKTKEADLSVRMTFGLEEYGFNGDIDGTIKVADQKLYTGKNNGRDQVVF